MKIGVTGYSGKVGRAILNKHDAEPIQCNILDLDAVHVAINKLRPDVIIHCASLTDVDYCEQNYREAFNVNVRGTGNIVDAFTGKLIYISTDHVFDGTKFYAYSEAHNPNPVNHYGATKWGGELTARYGVSVVKIVRTSKLFDYSSLEHNLNSLKNGEELEFTELIYRSFLHVNHFVVGLMEFVRRFDEMPDILNIAGKMTPNYYQFWQTVARYFSYDEHLIKGRKTELKDATPRPFRGGLDVHKAHRLGIPLFDYADGLKLL